MRGEVFIEPRESLSGCEGVAGALLLLTLVFSTLTAFVREAWAVQGFQIGVYTILAIFLVFNFRDSKSLRSAHWSVWLVSLLPLWGVVQLVVHTTASSFDTLRETLKWGSLASVFFLSQAITRVERVGRFFVHAFLSFACSMALLCVLQLPTSHGKVLWIFATGYADVYASFPNQNNYAQFVELALPMAVWQAVDAGYKAWWYPLACAVLYASAIVSASRAGTALCTAEVVAVLVIEGWRALRAKKLHRWRASVAFALLIPTLIAMFTFAAGWQRLSARFETSVSDSTRKAFLIAGMKMAKDRPLAGYGLGTFPAVYQSYAVHTFPFYANHAHNDWVEFAAEGGIPFLLLVLIPFVLAMPSIIKNPLALGLLAIMLHACVDYPFPRPAVSSWIYALLGCVYSTVNARSSEQHELPPT